MKVDTSNTNKFTPIDLNITFESLTEWIMFLSLINSSNDRLQEIIEDNWISSLSSGLICKRDSKIIKENMSMFDNIFKAMSKTKI